MSCRHLISGRRPLGISEVLHIPLKQDVGVLGGMKHLSASGLRSFLPHMVSASLSAAVLLFVPWKTLSASVLALFVTDSIILIEVN